MHAYLLISQNIELKTQIEELAKKLKAKVLEFPIQKIDDVRRLNSFTSLKMVQPTAIYINSIEKATPEAGNAFLKNLEEPQENLYYILTTSSIKKVLPTIASRCQTINIKNQKSKIKNEEAEKFLKMPVGEKLAFFDAIKEREKAVEFMEEFIATCHQMLHESQANYPELSKYLAVGIQTLNNLKANGNVVLQLTNFVVKLAF